MKIDGNISAAGHMQVLSSGEIVPVITLRDYFAAAALQGFLANSENDHVLPREYAEDAFILADAMLKARGNEGGE